MTVKTAHAKRGSDGLAIIGRTLHDLRGLRFDEGEEGNEPAPEETAPEVPDTSAYEAKIAELTATIAERDAAIADLGTQVTAAKSHNYDLLMQIGTPNEEIAADTGVDDSFDIDDLFGEAE